MTIVVDANVAIAVLDPDDLFHRPALIRCLHADDVAILNITRAEALIHPTRAGRFGDFDRELDRLGFRTQVLENDVADGARELRAEYGSKNFPLVDAVVVALGRRHGWPVVTCDRKWPPIAGVEIETLPVG